MPPIRLERHCALLWVLVTAGCGGNPRPQPRQATPEETRELYPQLYNEQVPGVAVGRVEPGPSCVLLGEVSASESDSSNSYQELRENTQELGGNYLVLDGSRAAGLTWGYRLKYEARGRAYRCPVAQRAVQAAPVPPANNNLCEPDCSPGYACVRGACVSACNPPCATSEQCTADRICRLKT